jgi:hypothetical protein
MVIRAEILEEETKLPVAFVLSSLYIRGSGGFGYKGTHKSKIPKDVPKRSPDFVVEEKTTGD